MGKLTFRGGIHPYEGKELSKDHPIEKYLPKGDLVYPLSQHIGAPSVPCVKKGDTVLAGQKIAITGPVPPPLLISYSFYNGILTRHYYPCQCQYFYNNVNYFL